LGNLVEEEVKKVPILNNIEHEILGREYKKGVKKAVKRAS
jgi:hypothetical protein